MTTTNLVPCRFCEEKKELEVMRAGVCWVECAICKCRGPIELFEKDAIESWNNGIDAKDRKK